MWNNIGSRLRRLAKITCWLGIVFSVIGGITYIAGGQQDGVITGITVLIVGSFGAWISSWTMYGLGIVVESIEKKESD